MSKKYIRLVTLLILTSVAMGLLLPHYLQVGINAVTRPASSDFYKFYVSAQRAHDGLSMYWLVPPRTRQGDACHPDTPEANRHAAMPPPSRLTLGGDLPCLGPNLNPPVFTAVMLPLSQLPYREAWWTWAGFSSICIVLSAWLLSGVGKQRDVPQRTQQTLLFVIALFAFYPTIANFGLGQLGSLLLLLLTLSWAQLRQHRPALSGLWLGLAIAIKPFLGLILVGLIVMRRWRMALVTSGCSAFMSLAGGLMFGWTPYEDYMSLASNVSWTATNWNASWIGFVDRAFISAFSRTAFDGLALSKALGWAGAALVIAVWLLRLRTLNKQSANAADAALFSLGVPVALLASPLGWMYYFPMLALSSFISWHQPVPASERRWQKFSIGTSMAMAMVPVTLGSTPSLQNPADWTGMDSWCLYTLGCILIASSIPFRNRTRP